jgi:hypothetical protein
MASALLRHIVEIAEAITEFLERLKLGEAQ